QEQSNKKKKKADADWECQKKAEVAQHSQENCDPNTPFTGALSAKSKVDLQDLAYMLNLEDGIVGTQKQLLSWITAHFTAHPDLCSHPHYVGLFNKSRAPQQPPSTTSSIMPA
ncbi:hypothetical protein EDD85DRAFT_752890, partial [Armillaria nabsnona]